MVFRMSANCGRNAAFKWPLVSMGTSRVMAVPVLVALATQEARSGSEKRGPEDRILHVAAFRDPVREIDKLTELYESLVEARREVGEEAVPFHKFAALVKNQVKKLRDTGTPEVAFRVAVKDGKVSLTARALKGVKE